MQKKTKLKSRLLDFFVATLCIAVSSASVFLFFRDLNRSSVRTDKNKIATIYFKHKVAQRKYNDRVVWERLSKDSVIYNEDTIRTADFAQAIIQFVDGNILDVYENTMIQLYYSEDGLHVSLDGGDVQLDSSSAKKNVQLELQDGSSVSVTAGSRVSAASSAKNSVNTVEVQDGNAVVKSKTGQSQNLSFGESVSIEGEGEIQNNPITVTSVPKEMKILNLEQKAVPVTIAWKTNSSFSQTFETEQEKNTLNEASLSSSPKNESTNQNVNSHANTDLNTSSNTNVKANSDADTKEEKSVLITVQTSKKKDFSKIEDEFTVKDVNSVQVLADSGTVYWRVFSEETKDRPVEGKVTVESVEPVTTVSPAELSEFHFRNTNPNLNLRWNGNDYADHYDVTVSSTPDMENIVAQVKAEDCFATVQNLEEGQYYWQVKPYYALNNTGYGSASEVSSFSVVKNEEYRPPELFVPAKEAKITYTDSLAVNFTWKSDLKNAEYDFILSKDKDFSDIVYETKTSNCKISYEFDFVPEDDTNFYWKVVRSSLEDDTNPISETRAFSVEKIKRQVDKLLYPPEDFAVPFSDIATTVFMWKLSPQTENEAEKTVIQFSKNKDFSEIPVSVESTASSLENVIISEGQWWWRVGVKVNSDIKAVTEGRHLTVLKELGKSFFINPKENQELVAYEKSSVKLEWQKIPEADFYNIKVFNSKNELVSQKSAVRETNVLFNLPSDSYECTVQPVCEADERTPMRLGDVSRRKFSVRTAIPVKTLYPASNSYISGLNALRNPVVFSWENKEEGVSSYTLNLYKINDDGTRRKAFSVNQTKLSYSAERLTSGQYIWSVSASTKEGIPVNSFESSFTIEAVPMLSKAVLVFPARNVIVGPDYLKKHRSIDFMWEKVQGATSYNFVLYKKESSGRLVPVVSERGLKDSSYKLKNLSDLDVGDFVWNVTAFSYAKDGYVEQEGQVSSGTFRIEIKLPKKVKVLKGEKQYGE